MRNGSDNERTSLSSRFFAENTRLMGQPETGSDVGIGRMDTDIINRCCIRLKLGCGNRWNNRAKIAWLAWIREELEMRRRDGARMRKKHGFKAKEKKSESRLCC